MSSVSKKLVLLKLVRHVAPLSEVQFFGAALRDSPHISAIISTEVMSFSVILSASMSLFQRYVTCWNLSLLTGLYMYSNNILEVSILLSQLHKVISS